MPPPGAPRDAVLDLPRLRVVLLALLPAAGGPARLAGFQTPALILVGERSPEADQADAEALAAGLPNARLEVLPGQGHATMHTSPSSSSASSATSSWTRRRPRIPSKLYRSQ